jgi:hypothetical protein
MSPHFQFSAIVNKQRNLWDNYEYGHRNLLSSQSDL